MHCPGLINPHVNLVLSVVLNIIVIVFFFYAVHSDPGVVIAKACFFFQWSCLLFCYQSQHVVFSVWCRSVQRPSERQDAHSWKPHHHCPPVR